MSTEEATRALVLFLAAVLLVVSTVVWASRRWHRPPVKKSRRKSAAGKSAKGARRGPDAWTSVAGGGALAGLGLLYAVASGNVLPVVLALAAALGLRLRRPLQRLANRDDTSATDAAGKKGRSRRKPAPGAGDPAAGTGNRNGRLQALQRLLQWLLGLLWLLLQWLRRLLQRPARQAAEPGSPDGSPRQPHDTPAGGEGERPSRPHRPGNPGEEPDPAATTGRRTADREPTGGEHVSELMPDIDTGVIEEVLTGITHLSKHVQADKDAVGSHLRIDGVKVSAVADALAAKSFDPRSVELFEQAASELASTAKALLAGLDQVMATLAEADRHIRARYEAILSTSVGSRTERAA